MRETYKAFAEELHTHVQQQYPAAAQGAGRNKVPHRVLEGKPAIRIKVCIWCCGCMRRRKGTQSVHGAQGQLPLLIVLASAVVVLFCKVLVLEQQIGALLEAQQGGCR